MKRMEKKTTGMENLDKVFNGLRLGDNVVWQVDHVDDYKRFALPLAGSALQEGNRVVYIRFAEHDPILQQGQYSAIYTLDAHSGFESFTSSIYSIIRDEGNGVYYIFDSLSDLHSAWVNDLMIGNFFMVICPYLFDLETIAYFSLMHNTISYNTIAAIRETTQLLVNIYNSEGYLYVHPLKVWKRFSTTMFFPHLLKDDVLKPITDSVDVTRLSTHIQNKGSESTLRNLDYWDRIFLKVDEALAHSTSHEEIENLHNSISKAIISRDERILDLARKYITLEDFILLKDRLTGTGYIGGKTVGMLLARSIINANCDRDIRNRIEPHDSFYIGSDVYYTYLVQNGWWHLFMRHKSDEEYFSAAAELHDLLLNGTFPESIKQKFQSIIEYYGQSPIIVRSSSLLEDGYGNAFAGKYESYFLVNQGSPEDRFAAFADTVRKVFASTMGVEALEYRHRRGLDKQDEQMGLLVQRVSGSYHGEYFYPDMGGVGLSYNTFVWDNEINPDAGMLRLVAGLATRAVNRVEDDYPRIISLDRPMQKPHGSTEDERNYSQHEIDILDIPENRILTRHIHDLINMNNIKNLNQIATRDTELEIDMRRHGNSENQAWIIDFDNFIENTPFASQMRSILQTLEDAYEYPVDIEFTVNFTEDNNYRINIVQCRPQQTKWETAPVDIPQNLEKNDYFISSPGHFLGGNVVLPVSRVIYVNPGNYASLNQTQKYDIARYIGKLNRLTPDRNKKSVMLMGPGRWGTTTPSLGIPVRFSEINNTSILVEMALMGDDFVPELSYGTHFFQDLVESEIFYIALLPEKKDVLFNLDLIEKYYVPLETFLDDGEKYSSIIQVYDDIHSLYLMSDIRQQKVACFFMDKG